MNSYTRRMNQMAKKINTWTEDDKKTDEKLAVIFVAVAYSIGGVALIISLFT